MFWPKKGGGKMETQQVGAVAQLLTDYGPWGLMAVLCLVVTHLYRQQVALGKEMRTTVEKYASDTAKLHEQTLEELRRSRECVDRNTEALSRLAARDHSAL